MGSLSEEETQQLRIPQAVAGDGGGERRRHHRSRKEARA